MKTASIISGPAACPSDEDVTVVDLVRDGGNPGLAAALERCLTDPRNAAVWVELEATALTSVEVGYVVDLYLTTLERELPRQTLLEVGARALRLFDEWALAEESLVTLLDRVLAIDATVGWAFERLSLELTTRGRYADLLAVYDRVLAAVEGQPRHAALLEEAADVARDGAGEVDRAIAYLDRLFDLEPRREAVAASLERLLLQQGRHEELLAHWHRRLEVEGPDRAVALRCRAAQFCLASMNDPVTTAALLAPLAPEEGDPAVAKWLEAILRAPLASPATRSTALEQLRLRYEASGRLAELIDPLHELLLREGSDPLAIHGEVVRILVAQGRDGETVDELAAMVASDPAGLDLVEQFLGDGVDVEIAACRPRIDRKARRDVVRRAAALAKVLPSGVDRAIGLYERLLSDLPRDPSLILGLGNLYRSCGRWSELVGLRRHELALSSDAEYRRALRLEIAELSLASGDASSAMVALDENLDEQPTSLEVIDAVVGMLKKHGHLDVLCERLERHGARISAEAPRIAMDLYARAAELAETGLGDRRRALRAHTLLVALSPEPASFDALARLHAELGEHAAAVEWLERLLAGSADSPSLETDRVLRLASARVLCGESGAALACVEVQLGKDPADVRLHGTRIELRRPTSDREGLVGALVAAAPYADAPTAASWLREAAVMLVQELDAPACAVELLERVVAMHPDVPSRALLADALYRAGRREEARATAREALSGFGARHPLERGTVHFLLGRIARELGDLEEARRELESAVKVDMGNAGVHLLLGKSCREAGDLERAERALHAALLLQRRGLPEGLPPRSETLVELHLVAAARADMERAAENLAAAFDVAMGDEREADALERALRDARLCEPLLAALERRLAKTREPSVAAALLAETSGLLGSLGRHAESTAAAMRGLALAPSDAGLHEHARAGSALIGRIDEYAERLESFVATALESGEGILGCTLLLRLGEVYEADLGRVEAAEAAYARAEDTSENLVEVWRRRARLAGRRGDWETQRVALRRLADPESSLDAIEQADTLYALADVELRAADTIDSGLGSLALALEADPRPASAAESLRRALDVAPDPEPCARLLESVARAHGDDAMLLEALEALSGSARVAQGVLREAVLVASRVRAEDRAYRLCERAVLLAKDAGDPSDALWAMELLTDAHEQRRDLRLALSWALRAVESSGGEDSIRCSGRAAAFATELGDVDSAMASYERILAEDPGHAETWASMLDLLRVAGDAARLEEALLRAASESRDAGERVLLQLERAQMTMGDETRKGDAESALRAVIEEEPGHALATELLSGLLDPVRDRDELAALLGRRFELALEGREASASDLGMRLAAILPEAQALDVVRSALAVSPDHAPLLRRSIELLDPESDARERADAIERLLLAIDLPAAERIGLAAALVSARMTTFEAEATARAVEGLAAIHPEHAQVQVALEWLAEVKIAESLERPEEAGRLLCAAARIQQRLGYVEAAMETLARAQAAAPDDHEVLEHHARALFESDRADLALSIVSEAARRPAEPRVRAARLAMRASLWTVLSEHEAAVEDLEEAQVCAGGWLPELLDAIDRARQAVQAEDRCRALTLRQAEVLQAMGRIEDARELLADSGDGDPRVLSRLFSLDVMTGEWAAAAAHGERLMAVIDGPELGRVAVAVADALVRTGRPEAAQTVLERAHDGDPSDGDVLLRLRDLYERTGAYRPLCDRLLTEARRTTDAERRFACLVEIGKLRLEKLGEAAAAIGPLSAALETRPADRLVASLLADAFAAAGLIDDAVALIGTAIEQQGPRRCSELSDLQRRMAHALARRDQRAALPWLTLAVDSNPKNDGLATELADLAVALGELDAAARALRAVTSRSSDREVRARAYVMQAAIAMRQGQRGKAQAFAKKAQSDAPGLAEVQALVRRLGRETSRASFSSWAEVSTWAEPHAAAGR